MVIPKVGPWSKRMIYYYFKLQFKVHRRKLMDFGLPFLPTSIVLPLIFFYVSNSFLDNTKYDHAPHIYGIIALVIISKLSRPKRTGFLKSIFNKNDYPVIRVLENTACCLPFVGILLYKGLYVYAFSTYILSTILAFLNFRISFDLTLPTPFGKTPFEFTIGFRNTFLIFPIAYFLTYVSVSINNFNLGIFSMLLISAICMSYFSKVENRYYVWNFNLPPKQFLRYKTRTCYIGFSLLTFPIVITLSIFFFDKIDVIIVFLTMCYVYLTLMSYAKYANFPNKIGLSQGILIVMGLVFPPLLFVLVPYFHSKSIKSLKDILQ